MVNMGKGSALGVIALLIDIGGARSSVNPADCPCGGNHDFQEKLNESDTTKNKRAIS